MKKILLVLFICLMSATFTASAMADPFSDTLRILKSKSERCEMLCAVVNSAGFSCSKVTMTLYKGVDKKGDGYWAVTCSNGVGYMIRIDNTARGQTTVLPCSLVRQLGMDCYEVFK